MKKLIVVFLALVLAGSLAAAEQIIPEVTMLDALKEAMSSEEVAKIANTEPLYQQQLGENTLDVLYGSGSGNQIVYSELLFVENRLTMIAYYGFPGDAAETLASLKQMMTAEYGDAGEVTPTAIARLFNTIGGTEVPLVFSEPASWQADGDVTAWAAMAYISGDSTPYVYTVYVRTEYLASIEAADSPDDLLAGSWILTDAAASGASDEELQQMKDDIKSGAVFYAFSFDHGKVLVAMRQTSPNGEVTERSLAGFYQAGGKQLTVIEDGGVPGNAMTYKVEGDRLELSMSGITMIFTRQD